MQSKIVVLGDFNPQYNTHLALDEAIKHLIHSVNQEVTIEWQATDNFDYSNAFTSDYSGLWIAPGSPYKDMDNVLNAIRYAREHQIPTIGNCGGFQHMIIEFARNVCGLVHADTEETNPDARDIIISKLSCSLVGQSEEISVLKNSLLHSIIGKSQLTGKYHCSYALNENYIPLLESHGLKMTARNEEGNIRAFELTTHPFFVGTLFQPALTSSQLTGKYHCSYALNENYIPLLESHGMKMTARNEDGNIRAFELTTHPFFVGTLFQPALTSTAEEPDPLLLSFVKRVREVRE